MGTAALHVGDVILGVRSNEAEMLTLLTDALRPALASGVDAYPNVSMQFGEARGRSRPLHFVSRRSERIFQSTDRGRILRAVLDQLDSFLPAPQGLVRLHARVVASKAGAVLLASSFADTVDRFERRPARSAWAAVQSSYALVSPGSAEVVLHPLRLPIDPDGIRAIENRYPTSGRVLVSDGQRIPILAVVVHQRESDATLADSPAGKFMVVAQLVAVPGDSATGADLERLAELYRVSRVIRTPKLTEQNLVRLLDELHSR